MVRIAVVEDNDKSAAQLCEYVRRADGQYGQQTAVKRFRDGIEFLMNYHSDYDIVFMDIDMPEYNGLETARRLRKMDEQVIIIFVTNMEQFAVKGYEVHAFDFIVKPVTFSDFIYRLKKAMAAIPKAMDETIIVSFGRNLKRLKVSEIYYLEIDGHNVAYHTASGVYPVHQSLAAAEKKLEGKNFCKCNSNYLVNLSHVYAVNGDSVTVAGDVLQISRAKKRAFLDKLTVYHGG